MGWFAGMGWTRGIRVLGVGVAANTLAGLLSACNPIVGVEQIATGAGGDAGRACAHLCPDGRRHRRVLGQQHLLLGAR
jgi:hypothetical protein